jgi:hypothetical protein
MVLAAIRTELYTNTHIIMNLNNDLFPGNVGKLGRYEERGENIRQKCGGKI